MWPPLDETLLISHLCTTVSAFNAVSYTHLDVYKRQVQYNGWPKRRPSVNGGRIVFEWLQRFQKRANSLTTSECDHPWSPRLRLYDGEIRPKEKSQQHEKIDSDTLITKKLRMKNMLNHTGHFNCGFMTNNAWQVFSIIQDNRATVQRWLFTCLLYTSRCV